MQWYEFLPSFIVDISDTWETKIAAIKAHTSQFHNPNSKEPETKILVVSGDFDEVEKVLDGLVMKYETTTQAAERETLEEANARVELGELFTVLSVPRVNQVHLFYRARLLDLDFSAGSESLEVALFREEDIPWNEIAFRTTAVTLRHYFADRDAGAYRVHTEEIRLPPHR